MPHVRFIRMDSRLRFKEILCPIEGFRSKKELERIAARKVPSWYALDYCGNPSRIVASRLLDFSCRRGFNTCSFGDCCDCGDNKAGDRSARLNMNGFTVVVCPCDQTERGGANPTVNQLAISSRFYMPVLPKWTSVSSIPCFRSRPVTRRKSI
jgi:hypothetical protein